MKHEEGETVEEYREVAPHAGAWVETPTTAARPTPSSRSPPTRGRGLKLRHAVAGSMVVESPPTRGRGLKRKRYNWTMVNQHVAPHAGAWVETHGVLHVTGTSARRPPRGGVG